MLLELTLGLAWPTLPPAATRHDLICVELELRRRSSLRLLGLGICLGRFDLLAVLDLLVALQLLARLAEELLAPVRRA